MTHNRNSEVGLEAIALAGQNALTGLRHLGTSALFTAVAAYYGVRWSLEKGHRSRAITGTVLAAALLLGQDSPSKMTVALVQNNQIAPITKQAEASDTVPGVETSNTPSSYLGPLPFSNNAANQIALAKNITPGSYFIFDPKTLDNLVAFREDDLLPIYHPTIYQHKAVIKRVARETGVPVNVVSTIAAIESGGDARAGSHMGAVGLVQPLTDKFEGGRYVDLETSIRVSENPDLMFDPYINLTAGMNYFMKVCLPAARHELSNPENQANGSIYFDPDHVVVYAKALIYYNGGPGHIFKDFRQLWDEMKGYGDHFIRFAMTAEVASGLRKVGYSDPQINVALPSKELDARFYVLQEFDRIEREERGGYSYEALNGILVALSQPTPGINQRTGFLVQGGDFVIEKHKEYLADPKYVLPLNPAIRSHVAHGGISFILGDRVRSLNNNPQAYFNINSN